MEEESTTALVPSKLEELLNSIPPYQRTFVIYRILGLGHNQAALATGRTRQACFLWRRDPTFRQVEQLAVDNQDLYLKDAKSYFLILLRPKALMVINRLLDKGMDWDKVDKEDKAHIVRACELAVKISDLSDGHMPSSYEEVVFRARRLINDATSKDN